MLDILLGAISMALVVAAFVCGCVLGHKAGAALKLRDGAFPEKFCYVICIGGCILNAVFGINCVLVILLGVGAGLLMGRSREAEA